MTKALGEYQIVGPSTNLEFLSRLAANEAFADEDLDTGFIPVSSSSPLFIVTCKEVEPTCDWIFSVITTHCSHLFPHHLLRLSLPPLFSSQTEKSRTSLPSTRLLPGHPLGSQASVWAKEKGIATVDRMRLDKENSVSVLRKKEDLKLDSTLPLSPLLHLRQPRQKQSRFLALNLRSPRQLELPLPFRLYFRINSRESTSYPRPLRLLKSSNPVLQRTFMRSTKLNYSQERSN